MLPLPQRLQLFGLDGARAASRTISEGEYAGVGSENPLKSIFVVGFELTDQERADLLAFLSSLTDETFVQNPAFRDPG